MTPTDKTFRVRIVLRGPQGCGKSTLADVLVAKVKELYPAAVVKVDERNDK